MEAFAGLMMMGYRVREVRDLAEGMIYLQDERLILVDLSASEVKRIRLVGKRLEWALAEESVA